MKVLCRTTAKQPSTDSYTLLKLVCLFVFFSQLLWWETRWAQTHALMWKISKKALRWLWQWLSPWSLLTLHPKMQMPATYASACSAARYRIWGKGCAWFHNVRRATSAFQRMRLVVGCNHGASLIRLPRPPLTRWRQVVKNDLLKVIGVGHLTSDPKAVATGNGQAVSERVCTQGLAREGWTSRCGGMENIGSSNKAKVG